MLNKVGISINVFTDILQKSKVAISDDNGKHFINMLTEYSSLTKAMSELQVKKQLLSQEVSNLEPLAKLKGKLEIEVNKLKASKATLEANIAELQKQENSFVAQFQDMKNKLEHVTHQLNSAQNQYITLSKQIANIEHEITEKQTIIDNLIQKVSDLTEQELKHEQLVKENAELEEKIERNNKGWHMFVSLLGMIQSNSMGKLKENTQILLDLLSTIEDDKYSPELLKDYILQEIASPELQVLKCETCDAKFIVNKTAIGGIYKCPLETGLYHNVVIDKGSSEILQQAFSLPKTTKIDITPLPIQPTQEDKKEE